MFAIIADIILGLLGIAYFAGLLLQSTAKEIDEKYNN